MDHRGTARSNCTFRLQTWHMIFRYQHETLPQRNCSHARTHTHTHTHARARDSCLMEPLAQTLGHWFRSHYWRK
jgi:hypothetical protein